MRVAVLGGGIMGVCTAVKLAQRGWSVTLFDKAAAPMTEASRWNEGKIHAGYLYSADTTTASMQAVISGAVTFRGSINSLIGTDPIEAATQEPDNYIVHRDSVVDADHMSKRFGQIDDLLDGFDTTNLLGPYHRSKAMSQPSIAQQSGDLGVAGFTVPEYSVNTLWLADRLSEVLMGTPKIETRFNRWVHAVTPENQDMDGRWKIETHDARTGKSECIDEGFDAVVNALWEGRLGIDRKLGLPTEKIWSHRYRMSMFLRTKYRVETPSRVLAVGPYGDIKNYDGHNFYVSWYPAGLLETSHAVLPRKPAFSLDATQEELTSGVRAAFPDSADIFAAADTMTVGGGWVYARGRGALSDRRATIHKRSSFGISKTGTYISVDTGKYSMAPLLADQVVELLAG